MNICCLPSLKDLGASTCTNIVFSKINDISCVSHLLSENVEKEGCTLLTIHRNSLGKDLHLPSVQGQALLTLQGTSGPCPVTNKICQQNHSTRCESITEEFSSPVLCWRGSQTMYIRTAEPGLWHVMKTWSFSGRILSPTAPTTHCSTGLDGQTADATKMLIPPGTISGPFPSWEPLQEYI